MFLHSVERTHQSKKDRATLIAVSYTESRAQTAHLVFALCQLISNDDMAADVIPLSLCRVATHDIGINIGHLQEICLL